MEMKNECLDKARNMASIGPISMSSINFFRKKGENFEDAKKSAVKEFLAYYLNYDQEELDELRLRETRLSTKGEDIIFIAMETEEEIHEIYMRKAEMKVEDITVRNYVPPNFHARFMHLNTVCTNMRQKDPSLKTQLRFGKKDIEVHMKHKGDDGGFKKVRLEDITEVAEIPQFDSKIKWRQYQDKPPKKEVCMREKRGPRPSTQLETLDRNKDKEPKNLTRANSNSIVSLQKKPRLNAQSSSDDDDDMEGSDGDDDVNEIFETPSASNTTN